MYNGNCRHIARRYSLVQGLITDGVTTFDYVNTKFNVFHSFTKVMSRDSIEQASIEIDYFNKCQLEKPNSRTSNIVFGIQCGKTPFDFCKQQVLMTYCSFGP